MKIAFLTTLYAPYLFGGAEKAATLLAEAVAAEGHSVCAITLHPKDSEEMEELNGVRVHRLPMDNIYWPFQRDRTIPKWKKSLWHLRDIWNSRAAKRVGKILDLESPDVVHSHTIAGFSASALREVKRRRIRLVHTMHDYYLICQRSSMFRKGQPCAKRCVDCALATIPRARGAREIDAVIPVSHYLLKRHRDAGCLVHTFAQVLPNVNRMLDMDSSPRKESGQRDPLVFGYIGRVEPPKGIEVLLEACSRLQRPWSLRIAGYAEPSYLARLKQRFPQPQIGWLGFTAAKDFYQSIDVCIVPSIWAEPQPYVVLEALECGKTLIVSDSGGLPEMAEFGRKCEIFPSQNINALAACLDAALSHPSEWRDGGFRTSAIRERFRTREIVAAHFKLYQSSAPSRTITGSDGVTVSATHNPSGEA